MRKSIIALGLLIVLMVSVNTIALGDTLTFYSDPIKVAVTTPAPEATDDADVEDTDAEDVVVAEDEEAVIEPIETDELSELDADETVAATVSIVMNTDATAPYYYGDTLMFVAAIEGNVTEGVIHWEASFNGQDGWRAVEHTSGSTMQVVLDESNADMYWRACLNAEKQTVVYSNVLGHYGAQSVQEKVETNTINVTMRSDKPAPFFYGDKLYFHAEVVTDHTDAYVQWDISYDGQKSWQVVEGAIGPDYTITLDQQNGNAYWRARLMLPDALDETATNE